jgi:TRAP-type C4-dicarboxylate transport system substrate-binding protein
MKTIRLGGISVALAMALAMPAAAQEHSWRIQGFLPDSFDINTRFREYAAALNEASAGAIEIEFLPVGAVVAPTETLSAMSAGVLTGHFTGASYFAGIDPAFAVIGDTMGAYNSSDDQSRWFAEGGGFDLMRDLYGIHGAHMIGVFVSPSEVISSTVPLNSVNDFDGVRIRSVQGTVSDLLSNMGAGVVVLPGSEVFNALQTGVVDATDWAWYALNEQTGLYTVADYAVDAGHSMGVMEFSVSDDAWEALSPELQDLVETSWAEFSAELYQEFQDGEAAARARIEEGGTTVIDWGPEQRAELREMTYAVWDDVATRSPMAEIMVDSHRSFVTALYGE